MKLAAHERRLAPRISVKCSGELASGTRVVGIDVSDISVTGCGVEIDGVPEDALGLFGVLSVPSRDGVNPSVLLPIVICNDRIEAGKTRLGLKFRSLSMSQMKHIISLMDFDSHD